jgi:acetoin utilization protein AcuC
MGTDPHFLDPLGHLQVAAQEWLRAVEEIQALDLPIVAVGGGGYELSCVPRMWAAAVMTLSGIEFGDRIPASIPSEWGMQTFADRDLPQPRNQGRSEAEATIDQLANSP